MHERFRYKTKEELLARARELAINIPFTDNISILLEPFVAGALTVPNRLVVQPMEGYDSLPDGSPSDLSERRYLRYASGGSGMIWYEAIAVMHEGRSNPGQLWITEANLDSYKSLNDSVRKYASCAGPGPFLVAQLTHSGRYSKPDGRSQPLAGAANPLLDKIPPHILSDDDLMRIQDKYVETARLSLSAGFDAVDIKACHGYLVVDLLAARTRKGRFGGEDSASRFRFMLETVDRIRDEVPGLTVTTRLAMSDLYKGGFGVDENGQPDFTEPLMLVAELEKRGVSLVNLSMGSPYFNAFVTRPFDTPLPGQPAPDEHPLAGVVRMMEATALFQSKFRQIAVVSSAFSYLRQFIPNVAAAVIEDGIATFAGLGRSSFAYPDLPLDLQNTGKADPGKVCITCSGCTRLIRNMRPGGCVIRDREIYGAELKKLIADGK